MNKVVPQAQHQAARTPLPASGIVRRKCACGNHTVAGGECSECASEKHKLQRRTPNENVDSQVPPAVREELRSPGQPLAAGTRAFMKPHFEHDFSEAGIHTDRRFKYGQSFTTNGAIGSPMPELYLVSHPEWKLGPNEASGKNRHVDGFAPCNTNTGVVDRIVYKEHCFGDCVFQHEDEHASDYYYCCERYGLCVNSASDTGGRVRCHEAWNDYMKRIDAWTECNAYNREGQCLTSIIHRHCIVSGGEVGETCCASLQTELDFVTDQATRYCPNGVVWACPFTEAGVISPI